jgi:demethylmenaquinone methyltransferase/2-methoxy-6-polyprenyl-1,4-benzoquinol methylase
MAMIAAPIGTAAGSPNWGEVRRELDRFGPTGEVPEFRCGTGLWTLELTRRAAEVTAVDASPEVLEIGHDRLERAGHETPVRYVRPTPSRLAPQEGLRRGLFFGFWLSHVPPERFAAF